MNANEQKITRILAAKKEKQKRKILKNRNKLSMRISDISARISEIQEILVKEDKISEKFGLLEELIRGPVIVLESNFFSEIFDRENILLIDADKKVNQKKTYDDDEVPVECWTLELPVDVFCYIRNGVPEFDEPQLLGDPLKHISSALEANKKLDFTVSKISDHVSIQDWTQDLFKQDISAELEAAWEGSVKFLTLNQLIDTVKAKIRVDISVLRIKSDTV